MKLPDLRLMVCNEIIETIQSTWVQVPWRYWGLGLETKYRFGVFLSLRFGEITPSQRVSLNPLLGST
jgi:hypothetical protein